MPPGKVRSDTAHLLQLAAELADPTIGLDQLPYESRLEEFIAEYRAWILLEQGLAENREAWAQRHSILLHLMVSGSTLGEAMAILTRFAEPVWGASTRFELIDEGKTVALILEEPHEDDTEGLVSALWLLSSMTCQLEFLVGRRLDVSGHVRDRRSIPVSVERFLFGRPLEYQSPISAVRIPKLDTQRTISANTAQIPAFLKDYMRLTVNAERPYGTTQVVADRIWRDLNGNVRSACDMPEIAHAMGMSASTLRRQLEAEGYTFKAIRALVVDRLTKHWLTETNQTIEQIAEQIGYSDASALRRVFTRTNGFSPQAYRKKTLA